MYTRKLTCRSFEANYLNLFGPHYSLFLSALNNDFRVTTTYPIDITHLTAGHGNV